MFLPTFTYKVRNKIKMPSKSFVIGVLVLVFSWPCAEAQQPVFKLNVQKDAVILSAGLLTNSIGILSSRLTEPLSGDEISNLDAASLNSFDRRLMSGWSSSYNTLSNFTLYSCLAAPTLFLASRKVRPNQYVVIGIMGLESALLASGLTLSAKGIVRRTRPYAYDDMISVDQKMIRDTRFSFFSGHTSMAACATFFTAQTLSSYHLSKGEKILLWSAAAGLPAVVGYSRVKAGKHFATDALVGYGVGALAGILVPYSHKTKQSMANAYIPKIAPSPIGMSLVWGL